MKCIQDIISQLGTVAKKNALVPVENGKIYWHISKKYSTKDLAKYKVILAFEKTFQTWQRFFSPIVFESTSDKSKAAIVLHFMSSDDSALPFPFDEETLAYAFFPKKESFGQESDVFFNDDFQWTEMHKGENINLYKVAVHEVGHALGFEHSTHLRDIMYPTYQPDDSVIFSADTKRAIEKLYGDLKSSFTLEQEVGDFNGVKKFLLRLFSSHRDLARLSEKQILLIGRLLKAPVDAAASRTKNAEIVFSVLSK